MLENPKKRDDLEDLGKDGARY